MHSTDIADFDIDAKNSETSKSKFLSPEFYGI